MPTQIAASWYRPMPPVSRQRRDTNLGRLLEQALERKSRALSTSGRYAQYSIRDLGRDSAVSWSAIAKWIRGSVRPERELLESVLRALDGYIDPNQAMLAAGYTPSDSNLARMLRHVAQPPRDRVEAMLAIVEEATYGRRLGILPEDADELYQWPERKPSKRKRQVGNAGEESTA